MKKYLVGSGFFAMFVAGAVTMVIMGAAGDVTLQQPQTLTKNITLNQWVFARDKIATLAGLESATIMGFNCRAKTRTIDAGTDTPEVVVESGVCVVKYNEQLTGVDYINRDIAAGKIELID